MGKSIENFTEYCDYQRLLISIIQLFQCLKHKDLSIFQNNCIMCTFLLPEFNQNVTQTEVELY